MRGVTGRELTRFLLAHFHKVTGGRSLDVNIALVLHNVTLAARIARAIASRTDTASGT